MKQLVNTETDRDVNDFIAAVKNGKRRADAEALLQLMNIWTGIEPKIWGQSIVAYGKYKYQRKNGEEYEWFKTGFSPGSKHMTVYVMYDLEDELELLKKLGPYTKGKACLYLKRLEDINLEVLKKLIQKSKKW